MPMLKPGKRPLKTICSPHNPDQTRDGKMLLYVVVEHPPCGGDEGPESSKVICTRSSRDLAMRELNHLSGEGKVDECGQRHFAAAFHPNDRHLVVVGKPFPFNKIVWANASDDPLG